MSNRCGPAVKFVAERPSSTAGTGSLAQSFACTFDSREDVLAAFESLRASGASKRHLGCLAKGREVVVVNWGLEHDNAFRRVVSSWLARDACVLCYGSAPGGASAPKSGL